MNQAVQATQQQTQVTAAKALVTANPGPIGLLGFGMTTILLNLHNAGFFPVTSIIVAMGLLYGGMAQIIAGTLEYRRGNTFGMTAFVSYGFFWITLVGIWLLPALGMPQVQKPSAAGMAAFMTVWGVFSAFMFYGTLNSNKVLQFVFGSLVVLFGLLALHFALESETLAVIAGYEGIICGASAFYLGVAEVLNEKCGRHVLPIGE